MSTLLNTDFNDSENSGRINLYENPFNNGSQYYGRFERNSVSTQTLIKRMQKKNIGLNELQVQQCCTAMKAEILDALAAGEAVNLIELGTMYLTPNGKFEGTTFIPGKNPFCVKFTPNQKTRSVVENIQVKEINIAGNGMMITSIIDLYTGNTDGKLTVGKSVKLEGNKLKISGDNSGIFLCPLDENNKPVEDENLWLKVKHVHYNCSKAVSFFLPEEAEKGGVYKILLRTYASNTATTSKVRKEVISDIVCIE